MNKPWIVVGITGDKIEVLHKGFDGEPALETLRENRGKFEQIQVTRNGHYHRQWRGKVTAAEPPKRGRPRKTPL